MKRKATVPPAPPAEPKATQSEPVRIPLLPTERQALALVQMLPLCSEVIDVEKYSAKLHALLVSTLLQRAGAPTTNVGIEQDDDGLLVTPR